MPSQSLAFANTVPGFNMRMGSSWSKDLAMSASANVETGITCAILHGCEEQDVKVLAEWLELTACSAGHPMLLPALFAEMQLRRHKTLGWDSWKKLMTLYASTGQYDNPMIDQQPTRLPASQVDYDSTTKEVLRMHQNTGYLKPALAQSQKQLVQMVAAIDLIACEVPDGRRGYIDIEGARIRSRLEQMIDDYERLIGKSNLTTDGASILIGAVSQGSSKTARCRYLT